MAFESQEVPFIKIGNRRALSDLQIAENSHLAAFFALFNGCFERDDEQFVWLLLEKD